MKDRKKLDNHMLLAKHFIEINKPDMAIKEAKSILEIDPEYLNAYLTLSRANYMKENYESSLDFINKALRISPEKALLYNAKAQILAKLNQYDKAIQNFETSISIDNSLDFYYSDYAEFLYKTDYEKHAQKINALIHKVFEINPQNFTALNLLFIINFNNDDLIRAERYIKKALTYYPDHCFLHNNYGLLLEKKGKQKEAEKEFLMALQQDPNLSMAQENLKYVKSRNSIFYRSFFYCLNFFLQSFKHFVCGIILPLFLLILSILLPPFRIFSPLFLGYFLLLIGLLLVQIVLLFLFAFIRKK